MLNKLMQIKSVADGDVVRGPAAGQFICGKISSFNAILITFRTFLKRYAELNG